MAAFWKGARRRSAPLCPQVCYSAFTLTLRQKICVASSSQQCWLSPCQRPRSYPPPQIETLPSGIARLEGNDTASGIVYTRLFLTTSQPGKTIDLSLPTLTAQCTQAKDGRYRFELFVNFGNVTDAAFNPPWHPTEHDLYPPNNPKVKLSLEFLGYTRVKPVRRDFEQLLTPVGQLRYNSPGAHSSNMEEIAFYFQYLRALPTLHIASPTQTATFLTAPLLAQIHNEPLCHASGL